MGIDQVGALSEIAPPPLNRNQAPATREAPGEGENSVELEAQEEGGLYRHYSVERDHL